MHVLYMCIRCTGSHFPIAFCIDNLVVALKDNPNVQGIKVGQLIFFPPHLFKKINFN